MGQFLSLSAVVGKDQQEVAEALNRYALSVGGGMREVLLSNPGAQTVIIREGYGNPTILYPVDFMNWDDAAAFLSRELDTPVFSFHIHDGDFLDVCLV